MALAGAIHVNFFAHHYLPDICWLLILGTVLVHARTWVWYRRRD